MAGRLLAFLGAGDARREGTPPGLVVLSVAARAPGGSSAGDGLLGGLLGGCWWSAGDGRDWEMMPVRCNDPAAIRRYLISY